MSLFETSVILKKARQFGLCPQLECDYVMRQFLECLYQENDNMLVHFYWNKI